MHLVLPLPTPVPQPETAISRERELIHRRIESRRRWARRRAILQFRAMIFGRPRRCRAAVPDLCPAPVAT